MLRVQKVSTKDPTLSPLKLTADYHSNHYQPMQTASAPKKLDQYWDISDQTADVRSRGHEPSFVCAFWYQSSVGDMYGLMNRKTLLTVNPETHKKHIPALSEG